MIAYIRASSSKWHFWQNVTMETARIHRVKLLRFHWEFFPYTSARVDYKKNFFLKKNNFWSNFFCPKNDQKWISQNHHFGAKMSSKSIKSWKTERGVVRWTWNFPGMEYPRVLWVWRVWRPSEHSDSQNSQNLKLLTGRGAETHKCTYNHPRAQNRDFELENRFRVLRWTSYDRYR